MTRVGEADKQAVRYTSYYEHYLCAEEPDVTERAITWDVAIGLQSVDSLQVSDYLRSVADEHINGYISMAEVQSRVAGYYELHPAANDTDEADKVAANIAAILHEPAFVFSPAGLISIHKRLFHNVFKFAGKIREYNITKKEWVLDGDTVRYAHAAEILMALDYDMQREKRFSFKGISQDKLVEHIAHFISGIWQIHPFPEGNTRTTAVFCIKYLRAIGFRVSNLPFAFNARYFRNALVRANYSNVPAGVSADYSFLIKFFSNLLLGETHLLKSRFLHIHATPTGQAAGQVTGQVKGQGPSHPGAAVSLFIAQLLDVMGGEYMSVREMMSHLGLKGRDNFLKNYLNPAVEEGYVCMLYPESPRHPRQKYRLTPKGQLAWQKVQH